MNKFENLRVFWGDSDLNYLTISAKFGQALALHRGLKGKLLLSVALFFILGILLTILTEPLANC